MVSKIIKLGVPTATLAVGTLLLGDDEKRSAFFRTASAFTQNHGHKTFDEHFPRGEWDKNWDFRDPISLVDKGKWEKADEEGKKKLIEEKKATATRNIFLIRHGQYHLDHEVKMLTPLGREQAELLGKRLANSDIKFTNMTMSTMVRATETANIILKHLPDDLTRTSSPFIEEGPPYPPVPDHKTWRPLDPEFYTEAARIESAYRKIFHRASPSQKEDSFELIVCHANVIRYFICRALQFPPEGWLRMSLGNCSLTWITIRPKGHVSVRSIGDIGHLPPNKISFT
ncbi:Serine/threonine-protein phosphatase Pgam5, mitochondrial [Caenorhabditis elegans]|uniref:Serine/threonine-protein phosphatase Pgam5, mitochondrial n=1 Tax=Caenorhabditis elegans TaxID=6239 RepID=PGAM5_CAEEL|nr:Serine/threonine-protein phosphatase Pgam5, mitochondrial [Caenorhabditis elegans]Q09422.2 RecName: Full=Serine/threonine-protein phosphatase Pgam5, mitochondrial; AltName: Full=Phosphoglycerate mutase family member 5 homolog [Caenorhabditis elegans]CCD70516.1 Serine/threonine-protein phosphatase Pgam5, mitochondrial [Caenorhabditis elegans]|eukprot:NP_495593.2 Serine/threonine-protein phosphatase Pgam5, mitochondrial [Caenorhabditis elegans]